MAILLREGHTLLSDACPQCSSPLFKMKSGYTYCVTCDKKVLIVQDDAHLESFVQNKILDDTSRTLNMKIKTLSQQIENEKDNENLLKLTRLLIGLLEALEKIKDLKKVK